MEGDRSLLPSSINILILIVRLPGPVLISQKHFRPSTHFAGPVQGIEASSASRNFVNSMGDVEDISQAWHPLLGGEPDKSLCSPEPCNEPRFYDHQCFFAAAARRLATILRTVRQSSSHELLNLCTVRQGISIQLTPASASSASSASSDSLFQN